MKLAIALVIAMALIQPAEASIKNKIVAVVKAPIRLVACPIIGGILGGAAGFGVAIVHTIYDWESND